MTRAKYWYKKLTPFIKKFGGLNIGKRQKFIIAVVLLSLGLFLLENMFGKSGFFISLLLPIFTVILLFWSNHKDIKENFTLNIFILPFFYSLAFCLFFFLVPSRFLTRILSTSLYAIGLYSLFLAQNIFSVSSIRTIALLSSARTVSFIITLVSYFFLSVSIFTLDFPALPMAILLSFFSFFLIAQSLWTVTLEKSLITHLTWELTLTLCLFEISLFLWFWPSSPTVVALFLTGFFYIIVGLSQVWFDKRLFKGVMWEYIWVAAIVFFILIFFTSWVG